VLLLTPAVFVCASVRLVAAAARQVSVPLTFVGGYMGTKVPIVNFPVKTNQIPRQIPPPPLVAHPILLFFSAGEGRGGEGGQGGGLGLCSWQQWAAAGRCRHSRCWQAGLY
jgi:hypothetical protein